MLIKALFRVQPIVFKLFVQPAHFILKNSVVVCGDFTFANQLNKLLFGDHDVALGVSPKQQNLMKIFGDNITSFDKKELAFFE